MTIDLRGIGDAVRAAAAGRALTVAAFAREALVAAAGPQALALERREAPAPRSRRTTKLHLRMDEHQAEALVANARLLGVSYGDYVGRLVVGTPLPAPVAQRDADRAALRRSSDNLAVLSGDIHAVMRLVRLGKATEAASQFGNRMRGLDGEIRRHIELASRLVAGLEDMR